MKSGLHIGTSGWSYEKDWIDIFYHSKESLLKQYLSIFDTAEINSTFYALPQPNFIKHLAREVSDEKFFTAKLPKKVTHDNRLDLRGEGYTVLRQFFSLMAPIKHKIEALLIQLPPWDITNMGNLETFFSELDTNFRYAIEFRHKSWLIDRVWKLLEDYGVAHVIVDEPRLPINLRVTADFAYIRWHGHGTKPWYNYLYTLEELEEWMPRLKSVTQNAEVVLGYFNNHYFGNAPMNALQMLGLLGKLNPIQEGKLERMKIQLTATQASLDDF